MNSTKKICSVCNTLRSVSDFHCKNKATGRLHYMCKSCFSAYSIQRWVDKKKFYVEFMGGKCFDCKGVFHYSVYEFHHLDPNNKDLEWGALRKRKSQIIEGELKKCVMLCANCHRFRHAMERAV